MILEPRKIFDISPRLSSQTAVWPGDSKLNREVLLRLEDGQSVELSTLHTTVHIGAHADAPSHFEIKAPAIAEVDLSAYVGKCRVVTVKTKDLVTADHLKPLVQNGDERWLVRTDSFPNPEVFNEDFAAFAPSAIDFAAELRIRLLGIDTPSIDPFSSKDLPSHHRLFAKGIRNLEGLVLSSVADGHYFLSAAPLSLVGFDGSPVRAILVQF